MHDHSGRKVRTSLEVRIFRFEPPNESNTKYIKICWNIYKYIQIYTRSTRYMQNTSASGPGRAAAAWPPPSILYISCISCIYLYIFLYILIYFHIIFLCFHIFCYILVQILGARAPCPRQVTPAGMVVESSRKTFSATPCERVARPNQG